MTRVIMHGCNGHMGRVITDLVSKDDDIEIVAGIDPFDDGHNTYPVFASIKDCDVKADAVIDFASAKAEDALLDYCVEKQIPVVVCTTGLSKEQLDKVRESACKVAVLKSANMSLGINTLFKLLQDAAKVFIPSGYDVEIVERHHNEYYYKYDRSQEHKKRDPKEIGISAVRGGTIVGVHDVIFAGEDEVIEFTHTAYSKSVFAKGAIEAAKFLAGKPAGMYDMTDVIASK